MRRARIVRIEWESKYADDLPERVIENALNISAQRIGQLPPYKFRVSGDPSFEVKEE